jgi:hypothetical protein
VSIVIAFVTFNIVMLGSKRIVVPTNCPMRTSSLVVHMIIVIIVRFSTFISHIIISSIDFSIYCLMTKIFATEIITKKKK